MDIFEVVKRTRAIRPAISYACPVGCRICYNPRKMTKRKLKPAFFERILDQARPIGFNTVAFGGGEPLVEIPLLKTCLQLAKAHDYDTGMTTSGYGITPALIGELQDAGLDFFQLSLGFNRVSSDTALAILESSDCTFGINFLVDKHHIQELPTIHAAFERTRATYVVYILPKSMRPQTDFVQFTQQHILDYLRTLNAIKEQSPLPFLIGCATNAVATGGGCAGTARGITVTPREEISFCAFCDVWVLVQPDLARSIAALDRRCTGSCLCFKKFLDPR